MDTNFTYIYNRAESLELSSKAALAEDLKKATIICLDIETTGLNPFEDSITLVSLTIDGKTYVTDYIPDLPDVLYIGHFIKFDLHFLKRYRPELNFSLVWDTCVIEKLIWNGHYTRQSFSLDTALKNYFNIKLDKSIRESFIGNDFVTVEKIIYAAKDTKYLYRLYEIQLEKLEELKQLDIDMSFAAYIDNRCVTILQEQEAHGVHLDFDAVDRLVATYEEKLQITTDKLVEKLKSIFPSELFGIGFTFKNSTSKGVVTKVPKLSFNDVDDLNNFNFASPTQLKKVLSFYDKRFLNSTNEDTILNVLKTSDDECLKDFLKLLLELRGFQKILSTYGVKFKHLARYDGKIRSSFSQTITPTGRFSSGDFGSGLDVGTNLQNIPRAAEFRNLFIAKEPFLFASCDLSGCELRIIADLSGDPILLDAANNDLDLHSLLATASYRIIKGDDDFIVSSTINKNLRTQHKPCLFGMLYGAEPDRISSVLDIPLKVAKLVWLSIRNTLKPCFDYLQKVAEQSIKNGYITSNQLFNKVLWIYAELDEEDRIKIDSRNVARKLYNYKMQATNADMIKYCLVELSDRLPREKFRLLFSVHDEINAEVINEFIATQMKDIMIEVTNKFLTKTSMKSEISVGKNWIH